MKKFFSLVAIAAVASTMFTGCGDKGGDSAPAKAKLTLSAAPATVAVDAEGTFTVTSDIEAPEAIVVTVKSSAEATLTVDPATVTIAKGSKTATGTFKGVANGKANITIEATGVTVSVPSVEITVGTPGAEIIKMITGYHEKADDKDMDYFYGYYEDPTDPAPEGERENLVYFRFIQRTEGLVVDVYSWASKELPMAMGTLKQIGDNAGDQGIFLAAVPEGTAITFDAMAASPYGYYPAIYQSDFKDLATGQELYIVFACGNGINEADGGTSAAYRLWAKIKLGASGTWADLELIESYVCMNEGEFKVGQKQ